MSEIKTVVTFRASERDKRHLAQIKEYLEETDQARGAVTRTYCIRFALFLARIQIEHESAPCEGDEE